MKRLIQWYILSVAWVLVLTAAAKLYSSVGSARILDLPEALLPISNRETLWLVGFIELAIALVLLLGRDETVKLTCIAWLGGNFLLYRLGVMLLTVGRPCPCLGLITEKLPVRPPTIDSILSGVVTYLVFGSLLFLLASKGRGRPIGVVAKGSGSAAAV